MWASFAFSLQNDTAAASHFVIVAPPMVEAIVTDMQFTPGAPP